MAAKSYSVGVEPPTLSWTLVRGDTSSFEVYVTDGDKLPLTISAWTRLMQIKRLNPSTQAYDLITSITPTAKTGVAGTIIVSLTSNQSKLLQTGDVFDIEFSDATKVWTIAKGSIIVIKDVTNS